MSRVILSRHSNGEEHVTVGFDRPLGHFFWSECDSDGESVDESYIDRGLTPRTVKEFFDSASANKAVFSAIMDVIERSKAGDIELMPELKRHQTLEYPASNVTLDLSVKE